jgi:hypothetical protein
LAGIFVSYRRKDAAGHAGRLYDRLRDQYGGKQVFRDVDYLKPGEDFVEALARAVEDCAVFLAVIGPDWHDARNERGERRLDDPADFIRLELETALRRGVLVLPVLVEGATMVQASDLPEPLQPLARRQAIELSEHRWDFDVQLLLGRIDDVMRTRRPIWKHPLAAAALVAVVLSGAGYIAIPRIFDGDGDALAGGTDPDSAFVLPGEDSSVPPTAAIDTGSSGPSTAANGGATPASDGPESPVAGPASPPPADGVGAAEDTPAVRDVRVPEVRKLSSRAAASALMDVGLTPIPLWTKRGDASQGVGAQDPRAGTTVRPGEAVRITYVQPLADGEVAGARTFVAPGDSIDLDPEDDGARGTDLLVGRTASGASYVYPGRTAQVAAIDLPRATRFTPGLCERVTWGTSRLMLDKAATDRGLCLRTSRRRIAVVRIDSVAAKPPEVLIRYTTWR